jgi:hypothetical protein
MFKVTLAVFAMMALAQMSWAMESSARISESSAKEVELPMEADKDIVLRQAKPDVAPYVMSKGVYQTPILNKAFEMLKTEPKMQNKSGMELALEIWKRTSQPQPK